MTQITIEHVLHLDARFKALHKAGSRDTERAFRDWRRAAVQYAEERRTPESTVTEPESDNVEAA